MKSASLGWTACLLGLLMLSFSAFADELKDAEKLYKSGEYGPAMKEVDAWLATHPEEAKGRFLKGMILLGEKDQDEALKVFLKLTEDYPELPEPYNNIAVIYASRGEYDMAKNELEAAITAHPDYAKARENLGDIYVRLARQSYEKALKLDGSQTGLQQKLELLDQILSNRRQP